MKPEFIMHVPLQEGFWLRFHPACIFNNSEVNRSCHKQRSSTIRSALRLKCMHGWHHSLLRFPETRPRPSLNNHLRASLSAVCLQLCHKIPAARSPCRETSMSPPAVQVQPAGFAHGGTMYCLQITLTHLQYLLTHDTLVWNQVWNHLNVKLHSYTMEYNTGSQNCTWGTSYPAHFWV